MPAPGIFASDVLITGVVEPTVLPRPYDFASDG
jgi:hypothetical protein